MHFNSQELEHAGWSSVCSSSPKLQGSEYGKYGAGRAKESEAISASVSPVHGTQR